MECYIRCCGDSSFCIQIGPRLIILLFDIFPGAITKIKNVLLTTEAHRRPSVGINSNGDFNTPASTTFSFYNNITRPQVRGLGCGDRCKKKRERDENKTPCLARSGESLHTCTVNPCLLNIERFY